jgi:hypothetical protein
MSEYLSSHSDIVALMVFEHQMHGMNLLTRIGWEARIGAYQHQHQLGPAKPGDSNPAGPIPLAEAASEVADYLLFVDEAPLGSSITGSTTFADQFAARGPRDRTGRSLRQFELTRRLFRYSCSYLIYSEQFDRLPQTAKDAIFERLWLILSGQEHDARYRHFSFQDRTAVVEILRETKNDLPGYFGKVSR